MTKPLKILSAIMMLAVASPALAQESALSKSITSGWKSVVKETSKAARSVSKAANDALAPDKPKKRKTAKRKPSADDAADQQAKPNDSSENELPARRTTATKPAPAAARQAREDAEDGPPVPLVVTRENVAPAANATPVVKKQTTPVKRLPPPPPTPAQRQAAPETGDGDWAASTMDEAPSRAAKLPSAVSLSAEDEKAPPAPGEKPLPITMIPPKAAEPSVEPNGWSKDEIAAAQANCAAILKAVDAVTIPEAPIREGGCGTPAPVRLVSIGKNPEVALSPPPLVTCDVVAGMHQWMKGHVQPLSRRHFGSPVIKIETMSDYSCRMAYGRKGNKLSEHGRANALDIRGFVTAKGETAYVLEQWGKTARDRAAEAAALAAQKAAAENAARAAAAAGSKTAIDAELADATVSASTEGGPPTVRASLAPQLSKPQIARQAEIEKTAAVVVPDAPRSKKALFLHDVHAAACKIFGTSLGPESNEAHRNHFHVDMAERKRTKICE